ncbi:MAG: septum formation initiator family protein [bacterium]
MANRIYEIKASIFRKITGFDWDSGDFLINTFLILLIFTLSLNVYNAYKKGINNRNSIQEEEQKVNQLKAETDDLNNQIDYYSSSEYRRAYARENQNFAIPGEKLYYVLRPEDYKIDYYQVNTDPIQLDNHARWWKELILGR